MAARRSRSQAGSAERWPRWISLAYAGETVLCPSNTFMATPLAALHAGARVQFVDCNRHDLCLSLADFQAQAERYRPRAAIIVHIGGHIAFEIEEIADYCRQEGIFLLEDCAHAHGAAWDGRRPGSWGDAGVYSLYATKTISTGRRGDPGVNSPGGARARAGVPQLRKARLLPCSGQTTG